MGTTSPDAPPTVPKLSVRRPGQPREEFELSKSPIMVGRVKSNDIVILGDTAVSREHCCFEIDPATRDLSVRDLGSSNGTYVNGKSVPRTAIPLKPGDQIQVGATLMIYSVDRPSAGALVRRLKPQWQNLPWPPREGENDRTAFGDGYCVCGRCGERFHTRVLHDGDKVGCVRCRAVWRFPANPAVGKADQSTETATTNHLESAPAQSPVAPADDEHATYIIRKPTSNASHSPSVEEKDGRSSTENTPKEP